MKNPNAVSADDKKFRLRQSDEYYAKGWAMMLRLGPRGGGAPVMETGYYWKRSAPSES